MHTRMKTLAVALAATLATPAFGERVEFGELLVLVEINATDGDAGFHALLDADAWWHIRAEAPDGRKILNIKAFDELRLQGLTENFFESAEPLCAPPEVDDEEPDDPDEPVEEEPIVPLADFLLRFPEGPYKFRASMDNGDVAVGEAELTFNLPAAPDVELTEDMTFPVDDVLIMWEPGDDLGRCTDESLVDNGIIADPEEVELVSWEVVVEVDDEEAPARVFSAQLPPEQMAVMVPAEFLQPFVDLGFSTFKFEVGAIEESGNRTFSEAEFEVE